MSEQPGVRPPDSCWQYEEYNIYYDVSAAVELTRRGPKTSRGLQVGDTVTRIPTLYGPPPSINEYEEAGGADEVWRYQGPTGVLTLRIRSGRVRSIVLGSSLTNE